MVRYSKQRAQWNQAMHDSTFNLEASPYLLEAVAEDQVKRRLSKIEERMSLLRKQGALTESTLKNYYGEKRFEQVAESNAIEGSTLGVGETQLAVLKGITVTGHDPAYVRDAIALDKALTRITELAKEKNSVTDIEQLQQVHALILGDRPGAGVFRSQRVIISGATHVPPKTWDAVMLCMEQWQDWSGANRDLPAPIRSAVLHAWLTHVHPYLDGNGRVSRAIGNLELIRAGYPPIIIKKKERDRYIHALSESDSGGDIRSFMELVLDKLDQSITGLEISARSMQGFDPVALRLREMQESALKVWITSVDLLASMIEHYIASVVGSIGGRVTLKRFDEPVDFEEFIELCNGRAIPKSWAFILTVSVPGTAPLEVLGYVGHRSYQMHHALGDVGGPALYLSRKNPAGFPKWITDNASAYFMAEGTTEAGKGDSWRVKLGDGSFREVSTNTLAGEIGKAILQKVTIPQ
jgi:Fic family protein